MGRDYRPGLRKQIERVARRAAHCSLNKEPESGIRNGLKIAEFSARTSYAGL